MSREFLTASISDLVAELSTEEKVHILSAPNWWNTHRIERLNIPSVRMSDGPNVCFPISFPEHQSDLAAIQGVRGSSHFVPTPAQCIPVSHLLSSVSCKHTLKRPNTSVELPWPLLSIRSFYRK